MNEAAGASEGIGPILFYGGRIYRLGYARGLTANPNIQVNSDELLHLALEATLMARFYAAEYRKRVPAGSDVVEREVAMDIERIDRIQMRLTNQVESFE